ncbi:DNA primase [Turneriella parva]|uniref:DNA primase n=1 Tax=Turneriella parva (strain ATCC BAA-1111 / DSM 21527 / NCTC 11395 / H) TaxID=869212 RepID=I4B445_TURPD|nr:DNA primase [Turneriella parva]AFM12052.1 DNA primase [Turneriella parva DSM 21527]
MTDADKIIAAIPVESYIGRFVVLKRKGNNLWGLCPFHGEKTPSFSVAPQKGIYKCFGCGVGGNVITFAKDFNKLSFPEALKLLADFAGIELSRQPHRPGEDDRKRAFIELHLWAHKLYRSAFGGSDAERYTKSRGIQERAVEAFELGYAPDQTRYLESKLNERYRNEPQLLAKAIENLTVIGLTGRNDSDTYNRFRDRLIFPIKDLRGQVIAFGGRLVREKENAGKYINSPETPLFNKSNSVYRLGEAAQAIRKEGFVIVCEGYLDVLGLFEVGLENAVAPLGTAFTGEQAKQIKRFADNVTFFLDNDNAGTEAVYKSLRIARKANLAIKVVHPLAPGDKQDPFDLSRKLSPEEMRFLVQQAHSEVKFLVWYFFQFKYNVSDLSQKKQALVDFYDYVRILETELERDEFLKTAAGALQIEVQILRKDFTTPVQGGKTAGAWLNQPEPAVARTAAVSSKPKPVSKQEKEIIAMLVRFPDLGDEQMLLSEIPWENENAYLLYSFFHDRLRTGEAYSWQNLNAAMQFLPDNLGALLAEIMMDYEAAFDQAESLTPAEAKRNLRQLVRSLAIQALDKRIQDRQKIIGSEEKRGADIEELMLEQQQDIDKRTQWFRAQ